MRYIMTREQIKSKSEILASNRKLSDLGMVKKYDMSPEERMMHDDRVAKIREDKTLTPLQRREAFEEELKLTMF
jgi:hypothetical protein